MVIARLCVRSRGGRDDQRPRDSSRCTCTTHDRTGGRAEHRADRRAHGPRRRRGSAWRGMWPTMHGALECGAQYARQRTEVPALMARVARASRCGQGCAGAEGHRSRRPRCRVVPPRMEDRNRDQCKVPPDRYSGRQSRRQRDLRLDPESARVLRERRPAASDARHDARGRLGVAVVHWPLHR